MSGNFAGTGGGGLDWTTGKAGGTSGGADGGAMFPRQEAMRACKA